MSGNFQKIMRFCVVGGLNTSIDFAIFVLLISFTAAPYVAAHIAAFFIATVNSFVLNRLWTFEGGVMKYSPAVQMALFFSISIIALGLTTIVLVILERAGMHIFIAKICAIAAGMIWNFLLYRGVVFRR